MSSGLGVDDGEDLDITWTICLFVSGLAEGRCPFRDKKWSSSAFLMDTGSQALCKGGSRLSFARQEILLLCICSGGGAWQGNGPSMQILLFGWL